MKKKINRRHAAYLIALAILAYWGLLWILGTAAGEEIVTTTQTGNQRLLALLKDQEITIGVLSALLLGGWALFDRRTK